MSEHYQLIAIIGVVITATWALSRQLAASDRRRDEQLANIRKELAVQGERLEEQGRRLEDHEQRLRIVESSSQLEAWTGALLNMLKTHFPARAHGGGD